VASSSAYWRLAEGLKDRLGELTSEADGVYAELESNDDPAELAEGLDRLSRALKDVAQLLDEATPHLMGVDQSLQQIPSFGPISTAKKAG
jgi:ABC-type transporter Mla subunit MlaD